MGCDQEGRRGSEEAVPGPSVFPSGEPGVSGVPLPRPGNPAHWGWLIMRQNLTDAPPPGRLSPGAEQPSADPSPGSQTLGALSNWRRSQLKPCPTVGLLNSGPFQHDQQSNKAVPWLCH